MSPLVSILFILALSCWDAVSSDGHGSRQHKVHNIVLYPERHSWCQTTPIKQVVAMAGFEPITIDNNVCVGACYSYSIPRTQPAEPGELIGPYCDSCQPKETKCYHVTLKSATKTMQKRVQIITNCSCSTCGKQLETSDCDLADVNTSELPTNLLSALAQDISKPEPAEIPELLTVGSAPIPTHNSSQTYTSPILEVEPVTPRTYEVLDDVKQLLATIQLQERDDCTFSEDDKRTTKQLLDLVQGPDEKLTDKDVMEFVNWANEHLDVDLDSFKLKTCLEKVRHDVHAQELRTRHRNFGLGQINNLIKQTDPQEEEPLITGIEGSHLGLGHRKGAHIGMGIRSHLEDNSITSPDLDSNEANEEDPEEQDLEQEQGEIEPVPHEPLDFGHGHGHVLGHQHHHIGEEQHLPGGDVGHLVMGPHGSLVVAPPVEAKLNLASDEVAPNQEGIVIDYHHHHHHGNHHKHNHNQHEAVVDVTGGHDNAGNHNNERQ